MNGPIFDVSGRDGAAGIEGRSYDGALSAGEDGIGGGDGSSGHPGTPGGRILMRLSTPRSTADLPPNVVLSQPADADVAIDTSMAWSTGRSEEMRTILEVKAGEWILLLARGGKGGGGGDGGDGQSGARGTNGRDATRHSSGENGGPGGDGGDGGDAGDGGDGASGGTIRMRLSHMDTYLLMLHGRSDASGGVGGWPGVPGRGGAGGPGGSGGSSYTYSVTDSDGTRRWHTNPGGYSGRSGRPGRSGAGGLRGGNGPDGTFDIVVSDGARDTVYTKLFDLSLLDVRLAPIKEDGIIEPGSRVFVSSIDVENVGGMPTPISRGILAYIRPEGYQAARLTGENWVISEGLERFVQLPMGLAPGENAFVPCASFARTSDGTIVGAVNPAGEYLAFRVANINPVLALSSLSDRHQRGEPFRVTSSLTIRAQATPFGREFPTFVKPYSFQICYPVQMSTVASLSSISPGEDTLVRFNITNTSLKDYGRESQIGREVVAKIIYDDGDLEPSNIKFVPIINGTPQIPIVFDYSALSPTPPHTGQVVWSIPSISQGATITLQGQLSISQESELYSGATFSVDLLLGEIDNPLNVMTIQHRQMNVRVSKVYKKTPGSATLLVVNNQTTKAEIKAWEELASFVYGTDRNLACVDVWDVSREGHFDLRRALDNGSNLCNDWRGHTIVVLANPFDNSATRALEEGDDHALNYLSQDQLVGAVASHNVHFCVISPVPETSFAQRQHLASPDMGINFTSSMAFESFHEILDPFSLELTSFVVFACAKDFIAAEIDVHADGTPMSRKFTFPWSSKPKPPVGDVHIGSGDLGERSTASYTHVEQVILIQRKKPFQSLDKIMALATKFQKQMLMKHPTRRYAMSACSVGDLRYLTENTGFTMPPKTQAGIRVRRLLDVSSLSTRITLTSAPASPVDKMAVPRGALTIHEPDFIKSPQILSAYLQSVPFVQRVSLYAEVLKVLDMALDDAKIGEDRAGTLRASMLADLACEQEVLRMKKWRHGLTNESVALLLPRLRAFCAIDLPALPVESVGRGHIVRLLAEFTAYMRCRASWYEPLLPARRSRQVTKMSKLLVDGLVSRVFSGGAVATKRIETAKSETLKQWKKDVRSLRKSLKKDKQQPGRAVNLRGRAISAVLGSVAGGKVKWCDEMKDRSRSIAGGICTEFGILSTPESFMAGGPYGAETGRPPANTSGGHRRLGSVSFSSDTARTSLSGTIRRSSIHSRVSSNRRYTLDLSSSAPMEMVSELDD